MGAHMRYGMNPHQAAEVTGGPRVLNGEPSMINYLDALNASALVREADAATGLPAAASFKHVSPAGAAVAGTIDDVASETWRISDEGGLISAYVRARDADPKSSFGDVVALSRPVDVATAEFLRSVICDAVIAPGYEDGAVEVLSEKRAGRFLVFEADAAEPPRRERRDLLGAVLEQDRDAADVAAALPDGLLDEAGRRDALLGMVAARYTQSNSVVLVRDGAAVGIGAGQQNRVDCVRLAGAKARVWWLRRHAFVRELPEVAGMRRQDRLNWQIRFAGEEMTRAQRAEFAELFGAEASDRYADAGWRDAWCADITGVTLVSDGFLPFRDNVDHAAEFGVSTIVEPGGSTRTDEVAAAAAEHGISHVQTGLRLFRH
ncbi:5-aminoimidazole-4-carboxamide ribonucleotide transformylase [Microbacterium bovistercoris]|uniref:5-aminoimidazole-4-carboxamide ribonucleotide transformylase n=2 Tax=Microbacterium bovistercoris TaxID=2293570 RepID=A0A371NUP4_9MICO|nr:5-aminoimidazole-4-carboxamide ribonucleotide transformylase [Microbacterium bovistercoris]